jgi:hypothetical protein
MALLRKAIANGVPACPRRHASIGALVPVCPMAWIRMLVRPRSTAAALVDHRPNRGPVVPVEPWLQPAAAEGMLAQLEPGTGTLRRFVEVSAQGRLDDRRQADLALDRKLLGPLKQASSISIVVFI